MDTFRTNAPEASVYKLILSQGLALWPSDREQLPSGELTGSMSGSTPPASSWDTDFGIQA